MCQLEEQKFSDKLKFSMGKGIAQYFIFNLLFFSVLFSKHVEFFSCYFLTEKNDHWSIMKKVYFMGLHNSPESVLYTIFK